MNRNLLLACALLVGAFALLGSQSPTGAQQDAGGATQNWEYTIIATRAGAPIEFIEVDLNKMGRDGWELVQLGGDTAVFKRRK